VRASMLTKRLFLRQLECSSQHCSSPATAAWEGATHLLLTRPQSQRVKVVVLASCNAWPCSTSLCDQPHLCVVRHPHALQLDCFATNGPWRQICHLGHRPLPIAATALLPVSRSWAPLPRQDAGGKWEWILGCGLAGCSAA
jgi:hypothetical protein